MTRTVASRLLPSIGIWALSVSCCIGCRRERGHEKAADNDAGRSAPSTSRLRFEPSAVDFGVVNLGERQERLVQVTNREKSVAVFRVETRGKPCTVDPETQTLAPHATATLKLSCQWAFQGAMREQLELVVHGESVASQTLGALAQVQPLLGFEPNYVGFDVGVGETRTQEVRLVGALAKAADLTLKDAAGDLVSATWLPHTVDANRTLQLRCQGSRVGRHAGSVVLMAKNSSGVEQEYALTWGCNVPGTLTVEPTNPYFNLRVSGDKSTVVNVSSSQSGFKLLSARVIDGPFVAEVEPNTSKGAYRIAVKVLTRKLPDEARAATGTLLIVSNDKTEPRKEIPLLGFGHVNKVERPE